MITGYDEALNHIILPFEVMPHFSSARDMPYLDKASTLGCRLKHHIHHDDNAVV
jgi:hypothetical protein